MLGSRGKQVFTWNEGKEMLDRGQTGFLQRKRWNQGVVLCPRRAITRVVCTVLSRLLLV